MSVQLCCARDDWAAQKREGSRMMAKMTEREEREGQQKEKCIHKLGKWSILGALFVRCGKWTSGFIWCNVQARELQGYQLPERLDQMTALWDGCLEECVQCLVRGFFLFYVWMSVFKAMHSVILSSLLRYYSSDIMAPAAIFITKLLARCYFIEHDLINGFNKPKTNPSAT